MSAEKLVLPLKETTPPDEARCPKDSCHVESWVYETASVCPRMYGRCAICRGIYIIVLPRKQTTMDRYGFTEMIEWVEANGDEFPIVIDASESAFRGTGICQRLPWLLEEHPLYIAQTIAAKIQNRASEAVEEIRERYQRLMRDVATQLNELGEQRAALSNRGARRTALRALEAARNMRRRMREDRELAAQLRATRVELERDISECKAAAVREPLPMPDGYIAPPLATGSVLCATLLPPELIYALVDPLDPELVRYIGRTCDPVNRYRAHCTGGSDAVSQWVQALEIVGRTPAMVLLERCERSEVFAREAHWIHHYRQRFQGDLNRAIPRMPSVTA